MTNLVSADLLKLAEIAPMSAGTRTKLRDLALRVQALEREHAKALQIGGGALRELHESAVRDPYRPQNTADV